MTRILKAYSIVFFLTLFIAGPVWANGGDEEPKIEKKKTYSKSYAVNSSDRVKFDNRFGELKISTWDKNEVKVDITMTGKANTDEIAQEVLDRIKIEDGKNSSGVYFTTVIGDGKDWPKGNRYNNTGFTINYVVFMPANNPLTVENEFGKTYVPDYNGEITISQKFGQLTAGKLGNVKKINIEFSGGSTIASVTGGQLNISFSRAEVSRLEGTIKANFQHNGGVKLGIDNSLKQLTVKNEFNELYIDASKNLSASFTIHTNFAELDNNTSFSIKEQGDDDDDRHGPKFDRDYSGKSGSGTIPIKINSEFGEVTIGHDIKFDVTEKDEKKDKEKKKTRSV